MKRASIGLLTVALLLTLMGCGGVPAAPAASTALPAPSIVQSSSVSTETAPPVAQTEGTTIALTINGQEFTVTLLNNETTRELVEKLPLSLDMRELNGNDVRAATRGNRVLYLEDGKILDEMSLPDYEADAARERETQLNAWLAGLQW